MREFLVALIFCGICAMCAYMAARGYRGTATNLTDGWGEHMPEAMLADPAARARANRMLAAYGILVCSIASYPIEKLKE